MVDETGLAVHLQWWGQVVIDSLQGVDFITAKSQPFCNKSHSCAAVASCSPFERFGQAEICGLRCGQVLVRRCANHEASRSSFHGSINHSLNMETTFSRYQAGRFLPHGT